MDFENKILEYENILNIKNEENKNNNNNKCLDCDIDLIITNENTMTCPYCGITNYYLYDINKREPIVLYKRLVHFINTIRIIKGVLYPKIKPEIIEKIKETNINKLNEVLKKNKLINYKSFILKQYFNIAPIKINQQIINQLIFKLNNFERKFNNYKCNRKNFVNYRLLIKEFLKELGYIELSEKIEILKSKQIIKKHLDLYKKIIRI